MLRHLADETNPSSSGRKYVSAKLASPTEFPTLHVAKVLFHWRSTATCRTIVEVQTSVGYAQPTVPIKTHEAVIMKVSNS
jgi:hypothetical protein